MPDSLEKLRPDRDLQCYFLQPSSVAALSEASPDGFVISGSWRQQFDWAVLEWNRDNGFEHPAFRYLPDGDLGGLELTYEETRTNCIPMDSDLFPAEWAYLRIWPEGSLLPHLVRLADPQYSTPIEGTPQAASATLELHGTATYQDHIGVVWPGDKYDYEVNPTDSIETAVGFLADAINGSPTAAVTATASGTQLTLTAKTTGANWNRSGVYGYVSGARTEYWSPWTQRFTGGASPTKWRVHLDFDQLVDIESNPVPVTNVRKMRWTYSAGWQDGEFSRSEFEVRVSNWQVSGVNRTYCVAGTTSRRIEDDAPEIAYFPEEHWNRNQRPYNFSGGSYAVTTTPGAYLQCAYRASGTHLLYLGTEKLGIIRADDTHVDGAEISVTVDGTPLAPNPNLMIATEDQMVRIPLGQYGAGPHTVRIEHTGSEGTVFRFDFLELALPSSDLPQIAGDSKSSLATDWDTDHSLCLAPERTAWMIDALGFRGRVNHYVGALWFYELMLSGNQYGSGQVEFIGTPSFGATTEISIARTEAPGETTTISHTNYIGDTAETIAKAFEIEINRGSASIRAEAQGAVLTIHSRTLGSDGNNIVISAVPSTGPFRAECSGETLVGGVDGIWRTDLGATPRLNRAARDWHRSFFAALHTRGLDAVAALSTEMRDVDPSPETGIAQRCPGGDAVIVSTPAVQTNFSPVSVAFWREAYLDLARLMDDAGLTPYLQFGEVQWWYFRDNRSGMPFYDEYTKTAFRTAHGREMRTILDEHASPEAYPEEVVFLPTLIGEYTSQIISYVRAEFPTSRFEVLYPLDVNDYDLNRLINYPVSHWTAATLDCLKTESFGYTGSRHLNKCLESILFPQTRSFPPSKSAHLIGISDPVAPWQREARLSQAEGLESVVLFALDQYCLIGYPAPLPNGARRSTFQG